MYGTRSILYWIERILTQYVEANILRTWFTIVCVSIIMCVHVSWLSHTDACVKIQCTIQLSLIGLLMQISSGVQYVLVNMCWCYYPSPPRNEASPKPGSNIYLVIYICESRQRMVAPFVEYPWKTTWHFSLSLSLSLLKGYSKHKKFKFKFKVWLKQTKWIWTCNNNE